MAKHEYDTGVLDTNVPPQFTLPLVDQVRKKGSSVEFSVTGKLLLPQPLDKKSFGECCGVVVEHQTPNREALGSIPTSGTVLCP